MLNSKYGSVFRPALTTLLLTILCISCSGKGGSWFGPDTVLDDFTLKPFETEMGHPVELTRFTTDEMGGHLSPDGLFLVYTSNQKGNLDIWLKDLTTGIPEQLTEHVAVDTQPTFSPDGESIAFISMRDDVKGDLYLMEIGDDPIALTDRQTADAYPVFHPDGESIILASGPEGKTRIVQLFLDPEDPAKRIRTLTDPGATQPAVSPDGKYLAYILRGKDRINRLVIQRLWDKRKRIVTPSGYHCGFPSFSPDGKNLYFVQFYYAHPDQPLSGSENGVIFSIPLKEALHASGDRLVTQTHQVSSGCHTHLFLQAHPSGLLYTTEENGNLDIWMESFDGRIPEFETPEKQLAFALELENDYDRLLAFERLKRFPDSLEYRQALYKSAQLENRRGWYFKQKHHLQTLLDLPDSSSVWQGLADVDMAVWEAEKTQGLAVETGIRLSPETVRTALEKLEQLAVAEQANEGRVSAYIALRRGDMLRLIDRKLEAMAAYERVLQGFPRQREEGVQAKIRLGEVLSRLETHDLQVGYYLTVFEKYPEFEKWQRQTIENIVDELRRDLKRQPTIENLLNPPEFGENRKRIPEAQRQEQIAKGKFLLEEHLVDRLRQVIDSNPDKALLGAVLQLRVGEIYAKHQRLDLAIRAMKRLLDHYPDQLAEVTTATFALGRHSLELSKQLRAQKRFTEAGRYYDDALSYFENLTKVLPPNHEMHRRAQQQFIALALLKAAQEEQDGDIELAKASYTRILAFDPNVVQAHRKLIAYGVKEGRYDELEDRYDDLVDADESSFIGHYGLGYLITFREDLSKGDLKKAEKELLYALGLNSQSPYVHMTLGWVYEMRELYLGDFTSGWIEEAIDSYDKAYRLNDRGSDLQTEADLLLNLGNGFSQLGNAWHYAHRFYTDRTELNVAFLSVKREALYYRSFGRAAFNLKRFEEASSHFERSLELARRLYWVDLEAELIARLALNYQQQGDYDTSTAYFEKSLKIFESVNQKNALAALKRSIALNYLMKGERKTAMKMLDESLESLNRHGTRSPGDFIRLALAPDRSLAPRGFDKQREEEVNNSLRNLILEDMQRFSQAADPLQKKLDTLETILEENDGTYPDLQREISTIQNRQARARFGRGESIEALDAFKQAYLQLERIQSTELDPESPQILAADTPEKLDPLLAEASDGQMMYVFSSTDFERQVINAVSAAELVLRQIAEERPALERRIPELVTRLDRMAARLAAAMPEGSEPVIRRDLLWRFYNALGLLSMRYAANIANAPILPGMDAETTFKRMMIEAEHFTKGYHLLRRIIEETPPPETLEDAERPEDGVPSLMRIRSHVQALVNLSEFLAYFEESGNLQNPETRSSQALAQALDICQKYELGEICLNARMIQAERNRDIKEADRIINAYLLLPADLLGDAYKKVSDPARRRIFSGAIELALEADDYVKTWTYAEQENRRLIQDEIFRTRYGAAAPELRKALSDMAAIATSYRQQVEGQSFYEADEARQIRLKNILDLRKAYTTAFSKLHGLSPRFYRLMTIGKIDVNGSKDLLRKGESIVSVLTHRDRVHLLRLDSDGVSGRLLKMRHHVVNRHIDRYLDFANPDADIRNKARTKLQAGLVNELSELIQTQHLLYLDIDRLNPRLPIQSLLHRVGRKNLQIVKFASLMGLHESYENRNLYKNSGLVTLDVVNGYRASAAQTLKATAKATKGWEFAVTPQLTLAQTMPVIEKSGIMFLNQPLVFEGQSPANIWLDFQPVALGMGHYSFVENLDGLWRSNLVVFTDIRHTKRIREERLLLEHFMNAYRVPGFAVLDAELAPTPAMALWFQNAAGLWQNHSRAEAHHLAISKTQFQAPFILGDGIQLYGYAGMNAEQAMTYAKQSLMPTVKRAIDLQKSGSSRAAVELYEQALTFIDHSGEAKFLDKVLDMLISQSAKIQDFERAIRYQNRVLERAQTAFEADPKQIVALLNAKEKLADYHAQAKQYPIALRYNQEILDTLLKASRRSLCAPYYNQRGRINEFAGNSNEALANYETAYHIYTDAKNSKGRIEQATNAARVLRLRLSDYRRAKQYLTTALSLSANAAPLNRLRLELELARVEQAQGNYQTTVDLTRKLVSATESMSAQFMQQARGVAKNAKLKPDAKRDQLISLKSQMDLADNLRIQAYLDWVNTLWLQGDYAQALSLQKEGSDLAIKKKNRRFLIMFNNVKGLIYADLGNTEEAVESLNVSLAIARELGDRGEQANTYNNLGSAYRKAGRFSEARKAFMEAMRIDRSMAFKLGLAYDYANLGLVLENLQKFSEAIDNLERAIAISREIDNPFNEVKSLLALGRIFIARKKPAKAKTFLEEGLKISEKLSLADWDWKFHLHLGRLDMAQNEIESALDHFRAGIATIEPQPASVRAAATGLSLEETKSDLYDAALSALARLNRPQEAFHLAERYRSRAYLDLVGAARPTFAKAGAAELLSQEMNLRNELRSATSALHKAPESERDRAKADLDTMRSRYDQVLVDLAAIDPELPSYVTVDALPYSQLATKLPENAAVLSYYQTNDQLLIWVATRTDLHFATIPISRENMEKKVGLFREAIAHFHDTTQSGNDLYRDVIDPIIEKIQGQTKLVIVPHGSLHFIPFAALEHEDKLLADRFSIQYLSSVNQFRYLREGPALPTQAQPSRLAMGWPVEDGFNELGRLPFTRHELDAYRQTYPRATVLTAEKASEKAFKAKASQASVLHLATHTDYNMMNPLDTALTLTAGDKEDGRLTLHEILAMGLKADLVSLSACNTALGPITQGDDIVGLNRAFLSAGARRVLSSLWRVSDLETAVLMKRFFRHLKTLPPAEALQAAQHDVRKRYPHPAYWAGFKLEGRLD